MFVFLYAYYDEYHNKVSPKCNVPNPNPDAYNHFSVFLTFVVVLVKLWCVGGCLLLGCAVSLPRNFWRQPNYVVSVFV